jgi:ADP-dependent NAD(P)H-hydrate dehydratase / NAD(P)H-hydrate epimerase
MSLEPILRVAQIRAVEAANAASPLMERAGLAAATVARDLLAEGLPRALVLAGPGNNGGDAFVVARLLKSWFFDVLVAFSGDAARLSRDAAAAHQAWLAAGGTTLSQWPERGDFGLIVDGLFGIGLTRAVEGTPARWIERANASRARVLALDIPSGLNADTGLAYAPAIRAHATATFIALKPGLLTGDGPDHCGAVRVHRLELDTSAAAYTVPAQPRASGRQPGEPAASTAMPAGRRLDWPVLAAALPEPLRRARRNVHKGSFGTLGIVGGREGMVGAAILAARAAVHLGAGKVWVGLAASERPAVDWVQPELMLRTARDVLADKPDALILGPGIGRSAAARELVAAALALPVPEVIDADALNLIAGDRALAAALTARSAPTAITPHPAEAARLVGSTTASVQSDRLQSALDLAARFQASVVLKGAGSVIAHPDGSWAINASGSAALASGGTGDVLAGMLGALLAQRVPIEPALELAVCLHGAAADALVAEGTGPLGLTASELAPAARRLVNGTPR